MLAIIANKRITATVTMPRILASFFTNLLFFDKSFVNNYNIDFESEALEGENGDDDGEPSDNGRNGTGNGEAAGGKDGAE